MGRSRLREWDVAWTLLGGFAAIDELEPTERQKQLQENLDRLAAMPLPVNAICEIANAILLARDIERERTKDA